MASDAHLVGLIRQGRSVAFEAAYDRHHRAILSFCRHVLGSADEAEDAVQQTFLSAYNDLMASDKPIHLRAWLFTIARNRCYSILRARREQPVGELDETATEGLATQVQRRQDLRDLVVDLQRLPDDQRAALVLAEMDALSHDQIATVLGVPREKVKALVFQARESLVASRAARETDCSEIREQLANLRGGALRRAHLRRHLRECHGCREFRSQIDRQRRELRMVLPVVPILERLDLDQPQRLERRSRRLLARHHELDPDDDHADDHHEQRPAAGDDDDEQHPGADDHAHDRHGHGHNGIG